MTTEPAAESATARSERLRHERFLAKQAEKAKKEAQKAERTAALRRHTEENPRRDRPHVLLRTDPEQVEAIVDAINYGILPDIYVCGGQVVIVETPSGAIRGDDAPTKMFSIVTANKLRRMLATNTYTYRWAMKNIDGERTMVEEEDLPTVEITKDVLATTEWPKLRPLNGIVTAPFFRPNGTLVQDAGYDDATGLLYDPVIRIDSVPEEPTKEQLLAARQFILGDLLGDFPWVDRASKANFVALLVSPILRTYLGGALVPLGAIDAKSQGTGKTLLSLIITKLYSGYTRSWVSDEAEMRKAITSILLDEGGAAVVLDNVDKGETVCQATLAALLTMKIWSDRVLGKSDKGASIKAPNNRLWMVTGNGLSIGGDLISRSLLVQLDAKMPNPETRPTSRFKLGNLEDWLEVPANRATVLHHLLILVRGWIVAGAPVIETPMRQFTGWASASAGFLDWLRMKDFGTNTRVMSTGDPEENMWAAFYAHWWQNFGDKRVTASELVESAHPDEFGATKREWNSTFVRTKRGSFPIPSSLGQMLRPELGGWHGEYMLNGEQHSHTKIWTFWLTEKSAVVAGDVAGDTNNGPPQSPASTAELALFCGGEESQ